MKHATLPTALFVLAIAAAILVAILTARRGRQLFIRRIPGLAAIDEAVGRATEMGRPILFVPGLSSLDITTLQALAILSHVVRSAARYRSRVIVPTADSVIYTVSEEVARDAYTHEGVPEQFQPTDIRYLSDQQFAFASGVVGILTREQIASAFYFGSFAAESLILAETGHNAGAIQVAGTPSTTQIPFFIAACDYTIIGDEFYAASAYLSREPTLLGSLVGQDIGKALIVATIVLGIALSTFLGSANFLMRWFGF